MSTTRRSPMTRAVKNSRTVTPFRPVPLTEKQVTTLASTPPATNIQTVPQTARCDCARYDEPACDTQRERRQEIGKLQQSGALPDEEGHSRREGGRGREGEGERERGREGERGRGREGERERGGEGEREKKRERLKKKRRASKKI